MSMNNPARALESQGEYEQQKGVHRQVLKLQEMVLGKEYPLTLTSLNNLAEY
jgi:hypothetical protein